MDPAPGSDELFRLALDALPDVVIVVFDQDLTLQLVRGGALRRLGIDPLQVEGMPAQVAFSSTGWAAREAAYRRALDGETTDVEVDSPDGSRHQLVRVVPVRSADGRVCAGVSIGVDITAQVEALRQLAAVEERERLVLASTADAIIQYAADGTVAWASSAVARLLGYDPAEIVGTRLALRPEGFPDETSARVLEAIRQRRDHVTVRAPVRCRDGGVLWCDISTTIVRGKDRAVDFLVTAYRDATALVAAEEALQSAVDRYRLLAEHASDAVLRTDAGGLMTWASPSVSGLLGWATDDLQGRPLTDLVWPDDLPRLRRVIDRIPAGGEASGLHVRTRRSDGSPLWVHVRTHAVESAGHEIGGYVITLTDIDEQVAARATLAEAEGLVRSATRRSGIGIAVVALDGTLISVNHAWCASTGRSDTEVSGLTLWDFMPAEDVRADRERFAAMIGGERDFYRADLRIRHADGSLRSEHTTRSIVRTADGRPRFVLSQATGVPDETGVRHPPATGSHQDPLGALAASASFVEILERELAATAAGAGAIALLDVDLDDLDLVKDSLGHRAGDRVLREVASRLRAAVSPADHVCRSSRDGFLVAVHNIRGRDDAIRVADRIRSCLLPEIDIDGRPVTPSVSIGVAIADGSTTAGSLLNAAASALDGARLGGHSGHVTFGDAPPAGGFERLALHDEIRGGLAAGEFVVHYQPIVSLPDHVVVGHEALVRWEHPRRGLLPPSSFLSVAERSGLIVDIGDAVLHQVIATLERAPALPGAVSINMSPTQVSRSGLMPEVLGRLRSSGVTPQRLIVEITETAALGLPDDARVELTRLTRAGVGLHIDDFGTGYSSVTLLRDLPVTGLKLDTGFVRDLQSPDQTGARLAAGLAGLARGLGLMSIAEGVETAAQAAILHEQGWQRAQGFLFGRPAPSPSGDTG